MEVLLAAGEVLSRAEGEIVKLKRKNRARIIVSLFFIHHRLSPNLDCELL